ncbi:serine-threonine protein kinase 19-domain-containing protein [Pilaira anomala]|nr:serine-threonine protein kinase 19-domain-containing protein [Pilaira anomala]
MSRRLHHSKSNQSTQGKVVKPDVYGLRRQKIKRAIASFEQDDDDEFPMDEDELNVESDAINAAEYLIRLNVKSSLPVCFIHQIYSIVNNHTLVDRELQEAFENGSWRKFHIMGSLEDEFMIMKTSDYLECMNQSNHNGDNTLFDRFKNIILNQRKVSIDKEGLKEFKEKEVSELVQEGFLLPHRTTTDVYWFSVRGQGRFMSSMVSGRIEILRILKKRHTKDIFEKLLKQKKLHKTIFNFEFLMHDLIGSGRVEKCSTTMGNLIRLTNKGEKGI